MLDCELNSDGEINPISILEDERKGPILVHKNFSVVQSVPFDTEDANVVLNGVESTLAAVKASQQQSGFAVLYYNVKSKPSGRIRPPAGIQRTIRATTPMCSSRERSKISTISPQM